MPRITIRLDDVTAAYFETFAAQFGGRSQAVRALIEAALSTSGATAEAPAGDGDRTRLEVRLERADMALLNETAKARGGKPTWWAARLLRAQLRGEPVPPPLNLDEVFAKLGRFGR